VAVEEHPLYPKWLAALESLIAAKAARDNCKQGAPAWTACEAKLQRAFLTYDQVAREI
jgi:hypothetical protein